MKCPQCGSINIESAGSRENYNMAKGMVGQALVGDLGSLAGFENQSVWKCTSCGCRFVEGLNKNKIVSAGYGKGNTYYSVGTADIEVKGNGGYSYKINGVHLEVRKNNSLQNRFEIPTFERIEYKLDEPTLILNFLCNDGRVRTKRYTDLSRENLQKLINALKTTLEAFRKDEHYDFIMHGKKLTQIVEIKEGVASYKTKKAQKKLAIAGIFSLGAGIYIASMGDAFLGMAIAVIQFPISFIILTILDKK